MKFILTVVNADKSRLSTAFDSELLASRARNRAMSNGAISATIEQR